MSTLAVTPDQPVVHAEKALRERPPVVIEAAGRGRTVDLRDLWAHRRLFYLLSKREVQVRYKQALLGVAWALIQPAVGMVIFTLFFGRLAGLDQKSGAVPYPLFVLAGLIPWSFFAAGVTNAGNSLVGNSSLVTKVYFPRLIVPASAVGAAFVDFLIGLAMLAVLLPVFDIGVGWELLALPPLIAINVLLTLAVGSWLGAVNVKYRDVRYAVPFVLQTWMFVSPVIYPAAMVPESWRWLLKLNPLHGLIEGYRFALFGQPVDLSALASSAGLAVALALFALYQFGRLEKSFADVV